MPLVHSKSPEAFKTNVKTLMGEVGKSPHVQSREQALAIAYATQRRGRDTGGSIDNRPVDTDIDIPIRTTQPSAPARDPAFDKQLDDYFNYKGISEANRPLRHDVYGFDGGGAVQDVINALNAGIGSSSGVVGSTNAMSPSSPAQTVATSPSSSVAPSTLPLTSTHPNTATAANPLSSPGMASQLARLLSMGLARGGVANRAFGGFQPYAPNLNPMRMEKNEARNLAHTGPIMSNVPGRTDAHFAHVPSGSYVVPADIISGRGQGNTMAGMQSLQKLFKMGPYGGPPGMPIKHGMGAPKPPKLMGGMMSGGGKGGDHTGTPVPVKLAGGELVIPPENLQHVVHPNLKVAHRIMDHWVIHERQKLIKTLKNLPGPAKD